MHSRRNNIDRLPGLIFGLLVLITIAIGLFIYAISPLRDPAFQPNSANAGSLIPWMRGVPEGSWTEGAIILAALLASSITVLTRHKVVHSRRSWSATLPKSEITRMFQQICWFIMGVVLHLVLMMGFLLYLLQQWIID